MACLVPSFVSFSLSLFLLSRLLRYALRSGGMLWFVDLTATDSSLMLPIMSTLLTYSALELAKMKGATGWIKVRLVSSRRQTRTVRTFGYGRSIYPRSEPPVLSKLTLAR